MIVRAVLKRDPPLGKFQPGPAWPCMGYLRKVQSLGPRGGVEIGVVFRGRYAILPQSFALVFCEFPGVFQNLKSLVGVFFASLRFASGYLCTGLSARYLGATLQPPKQSKLTLSPIFWCRSSFITPFRNFLTARMRASPKWRRSYARCRAKTQIRPFMAK